MKRQLNAAGQGHLFVVPHWSPPGNFGIQFVDFGEGGPSGNLEYKQTTPIPHAQVIGFCGMPVAQSWLNIFPMGQGSPRTRPASPQVAFGKVSTPTPQTYIQGVIKQPG